jgi:hypothetical protein
VTARALIGAVIAVLALPAAANAAVRPVQAYDRPPGLPLWMPNQPLTAQPGDTVQFRFDQTGNPPGETATHDVFVARPGQAATQIGATYLAKVAEQPLDEPGSWSYYCSIHPDSMKGTIEVAAGDPTPVIDPGKPWEAPPPIVDPGPPPALNTTLAPTVFEEGDNVRPTMSVTRVSAAGRTARVRITTSEAGTLYLRVLRGTRPLTTRRVKVDAGSANASVRLPRRAGRYRLAVWVRDAAGLESKWRYQRLRVRR